MVQVIFSMDNGQGEIAAVYSPTASNELCDGFWHRIKGSLSLSLFLYVSVSVHAATFWQLCFVDFCHCPHCMWSRVYETTQCLSVCPVRPLQQHALGLLLWPSGQEISSVAAVAAAASVGTVMLSVYIRS